MTNTICRCGKPAHDAFVCEQCTDDLARALGDVPWLSEELDVTIAHQQGIDYRRLGGATGGQKPSERPSPVTWSAADARTHLKALLVSWALFCADERVRNSSPHIGLPEDNLPALSRWLMWRVNGLALLEIGAEAVDELTSAVAHCHRLIDRPADRQYLGTCDLCVDGRLYARAHSTWARCDSCDASVDADTVRKRLLVELDDRLCTAAEIAHLSTYLGLKAGRDQVRKRINQWHTRGQLAKAHSFSTEATFRFGTVYELLVRAEYGRKVG
jgi:hypothetical protein